MRNILKNAGLSWKLLAVLVLLIFLHSVGVLRPVENLLVRIFAPVQHRIYVVGTNINNLYLTVSGKNEPLKVNQDLQTQIQQLASENAQLKIQLAEAKALLIQQNWLKQYQLKSVTARVIGRNPGLDSQGIILDQGANSGVAVDMPLITDQGIMVGKIFKVYPSSSEAILINDSLSRVSAMVQNETNTQGVVVGEHGLSLTMELIPQNEEIKVDDFVITAGIEPTIPRGLVIGQVSRVVAEPNSLFQTVRVRPLVRADSLTVVSILTGPGHD